MKNIAITRTKNTVSATYLPYTSYKRAIELATSLKGKIGSTAEGNFKATFNSVKTAEKFTTTWRAEYNANRKVSVEPTAPITKKPKASKGNTPKSLFASTKQYDKFLEIIGNATTQIEDLMGDNRLADVYDGLTQDIMLAVKGDIERMQEKASKTSSTKKTTAKKATAPKKSTTSSKKAPRKTKGSAFDFGKIKGKTNTDKNKALHAVLVSMGMKDSRSADYMAIWNARPWTK